MKNLTRRQFGTSVAGRARQPRTPETRPKPAPSLLQSRIPQGLSLGMRHRRLSDRRRRRRRRPRTIRLGYLLAHPRHHLQRRHRRRSRRLLPPLQGRHQAPQAISASAPIACPSPGRASFPRHRPANPKGLDYYHRVIDELLANNITPYVTLFHWDLPQALPGGWQSRDTSKAFADYAAYVTKHLGDRVHHWMTTNEFVCFTDLGYKEGRFAPGLKLPPAQVNQVRHNGILAHGLGVQAIRANTPRNPGRPCRECQRLRSRHRDVTSTSKPPSVPLAKATRPSSLR